MKLLFVCLGNICRSPMAEAIFSKMATEENLDVVVDSAGTGVRRGGKPPHHGTQNILDELNISYEGMYSRRLLKEDFDEYDLLFAMDSQNYHDMKLIANKKNHHKIKMFLEPVDEIMNKDIPDPWYTGNFEETKYLVTLSSKAWIDRIKKDEI